MAKATVRVDTLLQGYRIGTDEGSVAFCGVNLVEGTDERGALRRIVVDTGHTGRRKRLDEELARRGLAPADIDVVVCTHAHWDHIENLNAFEQAEIVIHRNERRYASRPHPNDHACPDWIDSVLERYGDRIREVEEGVELIPGVVVVDAPGHSAGTIAIAAETADGTAVISGDSIQNSLVAQLRRNMLVFWDEELASRTIDKLVRLADVIYPGHDQAFRLDADNVVEYVQDFRLTITDASRDQQGLSFRPPGDRIEPVVMPGIEEQHLPE